MSDRLYEFDAEYTDVPIIAKPSGDNPTIVYHRLRKPTLQELLDRESQISYEMVELNSREEEIKADDETANVKLWDKIIMSVMGYKNAPEWRELTEEEKAAMRPGHKTTAIRTLYASNCEIEGDEEGVSIGPDTWTVRQEIGLSKDQLDYVVRHILREPTEAERGKFKRAASSTSYIKGAKKQQVRVRTNLRAYIELYDALIENIAGGTVLGSPWLGQGQVMVEPRLFVMSIDPIWKRQVIQCLTATLEAQMSD